MTKTIRVRFLKDCSAPAMQMKHCGDGCCSWEEWENEFFIKGDEKDQDEVQVDHLEEGEDFELFLE